MSVYRIKQISINRLAIQKKVLWWWETREKYNLNEQEAAGEEIKRLLIRDAFRPKVLSIWSEKKPNGDKG